MVKHSREHLNEILNEPLAIIGMNCQFPGMSHDIEDVNAFYELLIKGQTPIKDVPSQRWNILEYYDTDLDVPNKIASTKGGFLSDPHLFDNDFFKIPASEAVQMDPQHRLFLEVAIRALNHANITLESLNNSNTGVYCGISTHEYSQLNYKDDIEFNAYTPIGVANSAAAGRLCFLLNLKGPAMAIDTACSSSLSALYVAADSLRTRQCSMAIVGGVHLSLCPENFIGVSKAHMLSANGECRSFDADADGYARSEGAAVVIVKRLSDALRDKDNIHLVINSIVMNQDGDGASLLAPNMSAQISLHQDVLKHANLTPADIDYIETHGPGTPVGDSVEFNAIAHIHQGQHALEKPLIVGALKSNLGHTLSSSGLASLIKVATVFKNNTIPPNLHYVSPNKSINPECIPAVLPTKAIAYPAEKNKKRLAQVSNFGFSGTNVSLIVEEPPQQEKWAVREKQRRHCAVISAKSEASLKQMLHDFSAYLSVTEDSLDDICSTLINCRDHYKYRCAFIVGDKDELIKHIRAEHYELKKVPSPKSGLVVPNDAKQIYDAYLAGSAIQLDVHYNKVDLPLYAFDRKPHWHEKGKHTVTPKSQPQPEVKVLNIEPIAVIGMSCRFPKAPDLDQFLSLLEHGESGMADIPEERWNNEHYYNADPEAPGKLYIKQLGLIENIKDFDADFFNISPREAKLMSPQLRVFMETSYHALEHANLSLDAIKDSNTGVFVGCGTNEYTKVLANQGVSLDDLNIYFATGNVLNALPGRVAYAFDLHGPIQAIDTACSSSMTAIHNACLSLQSGDCDMALAGGVNILLTPDSNITLSKARMLSPESICKTFSIDADGYARSEGCGVVVLKRLSTAIKDGDTVLAVIKGSAINSGGKSGGFTVPNGLAQEQVIRSALAKSKLSPADIDYVEAHGTGTPLADPIEANTLVKIFSDHHSKERPLYISSVKTNIGHCESASGVASVIKTILSLQNHKLFKHLNFKKLNPGIELKNTAIPLATIDWHSENNLRAAGVSSFGFSGANSHILLQEAPVEEHASRQLPKENVLVLSAKSKIALELLLKKYESYLAVTKEEFADICYTAATCRSHFLFRAAIKAQTAKEAAEQIKQQQYTIHPFKKEKELLHDLITPEQLQKAYLDGHQIDWIGFYSSLPYAFYKVKLPLYTFSRQTHWFEFKDKLKDAPMPKDWCYQIQWHHKPLEQTNSRMQGDTWRLIGGKALEANLRAQGLYLVDEQYPLEQLDGVIFAPALDEVPASLDAHLELQKRLIKDLLNLLKELQQKAVNLKLIVLTTNAIAEIPVGKINIASSPLIGFCKTLSLELPQFKTVLIDLDQVSEGYRVARIVDEIYYNHSQHYEHMVAYREGKRLVTRLKPTTLLDKKRTLAGEGRYLITGGCGGLGLVTAQALLSSGAREIILASRNIDTPAIKTAIKTMQTDYSGRTIRAVSLDVTDKMALAHLLNELNHDGLLKGIIHAAGAVVKAPLLEQHEEDVDQLFAAKVRGAWYLHELSDSLELDFFIVYSSIASAFGSNKESIYSAANTALDALIAERQRLGLCGTSIQWGPWGDVGMAKKGSRDQSLKQTLITNEQGHTLIKILINEQFNQVSIISPEYLKFMLDFVPKPKPQFHVALAQDLQNAEGLQQTTISNEGLSPWLFTYLKLAKGQQFKACKDLVVNICKLILELDPEEELNEDDGFFEIGFDSLMIIELANRLKENLEPMLKIIVNIGFDYPTINKLAQYIEAGLDANLSKTKLNHEPQVSNGDIAIIGMSCSLPGAPDIAAFAQLLEDGRSGIKDIPLERWDNSLYYDPDMDAPGKSYISRLGLIDQIKEFDPQFFGISPREAKLMEPQQRLFLEGCYKALEQANYRPDSLRGSMTGVYAGVGPNEYYAQLEKSGFSNEELSTYSITGNVLNLIPGRVAYTFDFKGPSISVDTACSSSLVALHYACQGLKNHETDYALAGGVNVLLMPESNVTLCKAKALSPDGQCYTFDQRANGYVRGEGYGVVFLKRLADAIKDGDQVLAVIKASAINNDGKSAGLTVPNGKSQEHVMLRALQQSGLSFDDVTYIEAHGSGTPLGDPIEVHAINTVYARGRKDNPLYLGTVKTNIGHLESASGVAGIIKTVIGLQKKTIFKHLNFNTLNPKIVMHDSHIALKNTVWETPGAIRVAGVNAFGFSGTNAHVILQEFPAEQQTYDRVTKPHLLVLSAKSQSALRGLVEQYQQFLETAVDDFADICFTAATCREHYSQRLALVATNSEEAALYLKKWLLSPNHTQKSQDTQSFESLITSYLAGEELDWAAYYKAMEESFKKVALPHYVFDKREFWPDKKTGSRHETNRIHPVLGHMIKLPNNEYLFNNTLDLEELHYIKQHSVFGKVIVPAAVYIESGLAASQAVFGKKTLCLEHFNINRPLHPRQGQDFQVQLKPRTDDSYKATIFARQGEDLQLFSEMELQAIESSTPECVDLHRLKSTFKEQIALSAIYNEFAQRELLYGEDFKVLQEGYANPDSVLSRVELNDHFKNGYYFHPVLLDGMMQSILLLGAKSGESATFVPYAFKKMTMFQEAPQSIWVHLLKRDSTNQNELCVDVSLYDTSGQVIGVIESLKFRKVTQNNFISYEPMLQHLYHIKWSPLQISIPAQAKTPELWVIARDKEKAERLLSSLPYVLIDDIRHLELIEDKHIVFLYDQERFNDLVHLCQAMFTHRPQSFILLTENAYAVKPGDQVNPYHTMASAFWKSFANELEFYKNYTIDSGSHDALHDVLCYVLNTTPAENQLAVRDSVYFPRLKSRQLPISAVDKETLFDEEAAYLIVGGTGGLGTLLIEYLVSRGVKQVILCSRSNAAADIQEIIAKAKLQGISVRHEQGDASNYQQMKKIITDINKGKHALKGVFHLAGVLKDGLIANLSDEDIEAVLNAKMNSALMVHQLTKDIKLDHFVLFSSSASVLGARGQGIYAAANGFLDGLAHLRQQQGLPALAINWGPFADVGMTAGLTHAMQKHGFIPLQRESMDILDLLLKSGVSQIVPCSMHWNSYANYSFKQGLLSELITRNNSGNQRFLNSLQRQNRDKRVEMLSQALCEIVADVLALDQRDVIKPEDDLFSLGMDSLMAIEIRNRIHDTLQCPMLSLSIEYFINEPRIVKISRNIVRELDRNVGNVASVVTSEKTREALCDFQYIFWVLNKCDYSFNIGMQIRIEGALNKDYVSRAFDAVVRQNDAFWLSFNKEQPVQTLQRAGQFHLLYKDISLSDEAKRLNQEFLTNITQRVPLTDRQPLIRVHLYRVNNNVHELHIIIPHIIVDDRSCDIVFKEFRHNYELLMRKEALSPIVKEGSYLHYVGNNNRHYAMNLKEKIDFWQAYNRGFEMLSFGSRYHVADAAQQLVHLSHYGINQEALERFAGWHQARNINVSTGLIAACQIVFYMMSGQSKIPLILIHSGREGSEYKSVVGLFSEYKRINSVLDVDSTFVDYVRTLDEQLLVTGPYQKCSHFIKDVGLRGVGLSFGQYLTFWINRWRLGAAFRGSRLSDGIVDLYLRYLSRIESIKQVISFKSRLNRLFGWHIPLQKPDRLRVLMSVTPSFFSKELTDRRFAGLDYSFPNHFACMDRPISNRTLWVYFSRNQEGEPVLSINGPLTVEARELIARLFHQIMLRVVEDDGDQIGSLIADFD